MFKFLLLSVIEKETYIEVLLPIEIVDIEGECCKRKLLKNLEPK